MTLIHILKAPKTTTEAEREQLAGLDRYQKKYLSRRYCGGCDLPLDQIACGSVYDACDEAGRIKRRRLCLSEYEPRINRRKK